MFLEFWSNWLRLITLCENCTVFWGSSPDCIETRTNIFLEYVRKYRHFMSHRPFKWPEFSTYPYKMLNTPLKFPSYLGVLKIHVFFVLCTFIECGILELKCMLRPILAEIWSNQGESSGRPLIRWHNARIRINNYKLRHSQPLKLSAVRNK